MSTSRAKAAERQAVLKKLIPHIKKHYKVPNPPTERPVLETMIFAICLEDASLEGAEKAFKRFFAEYPDLNEARVSSVNELAPVFEGLTDPDWRAFRLRGVLQFIFEKNFTFEFEALKKKTLDLAVKQLAKIKHLTSFVRNFTLQSAVGAHLLPIDPASKHALVFLGLFNPGLSEEEIGEGLKSSVRKAEGPAFCMAIRSLATDPQIRAGFHPHPQLPVSQEEGHDPATAFDRLADLTKLGGDGYVKRQIAALEKAAAVEKAVADKHAAEAAKAEAKAAEKKAKEEAKAKEAALKDKEKAKAAAAKEKEAAKPKPVAAKPKPAEKPVAKPAAKHSPAKPVAKPAAKKPAPVKAAAKKAEKKPAKKPKR